MYVENASNLMSCLFGLEKNGQLFPMNCAKDGHSYIRSNYIHTICWVGVGLGIHSDNTNTVQT